LCEGLDILRIRVIVAGGYMFPSDYLCFTKTVVTWVVPEYSLLITSRSVVTDQGVKKHASP
jgi:hypothetical protein